MASKKKIFSSREGYCQLNPEKASEILKVFDYVCCREVKSLFDYFSYKFDFGFYFNRCG